tara:strand:- start:45262 stop:45531 length:270 start_codon:yes stop_codon:yes gene_type:complete
MVVRESILFKSLRKPVDVLLKLAWVAFCLLSSRGSGSFPKPKYAEYLFKPSVTLLLVLARDMDSSASPTRASRPKRRFKLEVLPTVPSR